MHIKFISLGITAAALITFANAFETTIGRDGTVNSAAGDLGSSSINFGLDSFYRGDNDNSGAGSLTSRSLSGILIPVVQAVNPSTTSGLQSGLGDTAGEFLALPGNSRPERQTLGGFLNKRSLAVSKKVASAIRRRHVYARRDQEEENEDEEQAFAEEKSVVIAEDDKSVDQGEENTEETEEDKDSKNSK